MERHVLDLISYVSQQGVSVRGVTRHFDWPGPVPPNVEIVLIPDRTPFARLNNWFFEANALGKCNPIWPTIGVSRVPGVDICIVGGTHRGHLLDRKRVRFGFWDRKTIENEQAMYKYAKTIIAHSSKVATEISQLYEVDPQKIRALYPPVDTTVFSLNARSGRKFFREQIGFSAEDFFLLFPSNNHTLKGADLILEALHNFDPRIKLVVAGKEPLQAPNVINLGFVRDMPTLYAAADAVILASQYEAFGLVGPEAILCGTPAIFAKTVGAAEVLSAEACIQFERTIPSLRSALRKAISKFEDGSLQLHEPSEHIHYPYSPSEHFSEVIEILTNAIKS